MPMGGLGNLRVGVLLLHRERELGHEGPMLIHAGPVLGSVQVLNALTCMQRLKASSRPVAIRGSTVQQMFAVQVLQKVPLHPESCHGTRMVKC